MVEPYVTAQEIFKLPIQHLNNRAVQASGGAIILYTTQVFTNSSVSQSQFISYNASGSGGAVYTSGSSVPITQCQFVNNTASGSDGAVYMSMFDITTTVTVAHCQVRNNSARRGGALYMHVYVLYQNSEATAMIIQCQIVNNTATNNGGGIFVYIYAAYLYNITIITKVNQCQLINNEASGNGGAVYMEKVTTRSTTKGNTSVIDCKFVNNTAGGSGGAMYKTGSNDSIMVDNNYCSSNIANAFGGSFYISGTNSSVSVTDSTFINNTAITEGGGAIYSNGQYYANVTLTSSTFHNNSASYCSVLDVDN